MLQLTIKTNALVGLVPQEWLNSSRMARKAAGGVRELMKALDATDAHKGSKTVSRGKEKYTFTQERSDHRRKHRSEGVDNGEIAKALTQGKFEKDGKRSVAYKGDTKIIKVSKKESADITTSYKEDRFRTHTKKKPGQEPSSTGR